MAVEKVSLSEINSVRADIPQTPKIAPKQTQKSNDRNYVSRISDKQIAEFFAPYGYESHERSVDGSCIFVLCNSFQAIFDDFTVMTADRNDFYKSHSLFYDNFTSLCEEIRITPDQAIADRLEDEIFNSMPYYVEKKRQFIENNLKAVSANQQFGKLLKASTEKQAHRENYATLNKIYGDSDPVKIADTLARLTPNK